MRYNWCECLRGAFSLKEKEKKREFFFDRSTWFHLAANNTSTGQYIIP